MDVDDGDLGRLRAAVGLVFQNPDDQLFSLTVFEDVAFGPLHMGLDEDEVRERVAEALAAAPSATAYVGWRSVTTGKPVRLRSCW